MKKIALSFALSAIVSGVAFGATSASASYVENFPASVCATDNATIGAGDVVFNNSGSASLSFYCPLPSNGSALSALSAFGSDNGNTTTVYECNISGGGTVSSCYSTSSSSGNYTLSMSTSTSYYSPSNFNYLWVVLPKTNGLVQSEFYGYQQQIASAF
jgi:hypothetical protein